MVNGQPMEDMAMMTSRPVLLLRAPTSPDRYETTLARASYRPLSLPVLETAFENLEDLSHIIRGEDERGPVDGIIVTSARAVEACAQAGTDINWRNIRFYAVGPATASQLAQLPNPPQDVRGTESGTAERLADFIVKDANREDNLLYLTGDKNRETLSRVVREGLGEHIMKELRVYGTCGVRNFEDTLAHAIQGEETDEENSQPWWIVFFAPSTATHVMPALRTRFSLPMAVAVKRKGIDRLNENELRRARVAAIGPTTAEYLRNELGLRVDAVPDVPSADSLVLALDKALYVE
ncbi:tetrapyrrole biosynthesis, uroporphyrinogen III synthase [Multifurca ochricompacta]|uniref:Tetrapyrrole biosynthesis, uroporphyrinogen III synthase n=1 Tax=Multifurca ochricompacta TaxID=376703 RepID=A0AAD4M473_9AGAM|nr:tetrapyrrole biosynthesis, uroporphyrinogen III synthase [Multifurca ochricompacta]